MTPASKREGPSAGSLAGRKAAVLRAIVSHYVSTGEPAGSKTVVERFHLDVSPATVRNEMAALEDLGLIYQPHTSAGRVPTDAGYRYFVDEMGGRTRLPAGQSQQIRRFFGEQRWELQDALRHTASLLSDLTDHAAVVFAPALDSSIVRHVELVRLAGTRAMVVLVTDTGRVKNHLVSVPETLDDVQLERVGEMLNRVMVDTPLETAPGTLARSVDRFPLELRDAAASVALVLKVEAAEDEAESVFLEGASNIVNEEKFQDLETVRQVIGLLEHRRLLLEVLADALESPAVSVRIGSENQASEMQYCSVITASYGDGAKALGSLGVVGPTRMDYFRTIAAVHEVSANLGRMLTDLGM